MKNAVFACASHRGLSRETSVSVDACQIPLLSIIGVSGMGLARNRTLDGALNYALEHDVDTIVHIDDDMSFRPEDVQRLVDISREHGCPASAVYLTATRDIVGRPLHPDPSWEKARWLVGLGLVAIPAACLADLRARSTVSVMGVPSYTWEGPCDRHSWLGVDYRLFERMGGAIMAPVLAGHVKPTIITPHTALLDMLTTTGGFEQGRPTTGES